MTCVYCKISFCENKWAYDEKLSGKCVNCYNIAQRTETIEYHEQFMPPKIEKVKPVIRYLGKTKEEIDRNRALYAEEDASGILHQ